MYFFITITKHKATVKSGQNLHCQIDFTKATDNWIPWKQLANISFTYKITLSSLKVFNLFTFSQVQTHSRNLGFVFGWIVWTSRCPLFCLRASLKVFNLKSASFKGVSLSAQACTQTARRAAEAVSLASGFNISSFLTISYNK